MVRNENLVDNLRITNSINVVGSKERKKKTEGNFLKKLGLVVVVVTKLIGSLKPNRYKMSTDLNNASFRSVFVMLIEPKPNWLNSGSVWPILFGISA